MSTAVIELLLLDAELFDDESDEGVWDEADDAVLKLFEEDVELEDELFVDAVDPELTVDLLLVLDDWSFEIDDEVDELLVFEETELIVEAVEAEVADEAVDKLLGVFEDAEDAVDRLLLVLDDVDVELVEPVDEEDDSPTISVAVNEVYWMPVVAVSAELPEFLKPAAPTLVTVESVTEMTATPFHQTSMAVPTIFSLYSIADTVGNVITAFEPIWVGVLELYLNNCKPEPERYLV